MLQEFITTLKGELECSWRHAAMTCSTFHNATMLLPEPTYLQSLWVMEASGISSQTNQNRDNREVVHWLNHKSCGAWQSHGKSPCHRSVSLPSSTREGSKADGTNKICPLELKELELIAVIAAVGMRDNERLRKHFILCSSLFHTKLFLFQIESGHIQHVSFSTHLSGVESHPYEGQMWQSATYLRTVGCIWGEKWNQRLDVDSGKIRSPRRWWRANGVQELQT